MYYTIRHVTRFRYSEPVSESVMSVRMQPRNEGRQNCLRFDLRTSPRASLTAYEDDLHNRVHHFDVPDKHTHLTLRAESLVEIEPAPPIAEALKSSTWKALDDMTASDEYWDMLMPSMYARPTDALLDLAREIDATRGTDPLSTLRRITEALHGAFAYDSESTGVNSPIDDALAGRRGVCQDFTHIMLALVRPLGIPCRYVSGYLFHRVEDHDRSARDATHAWVEALLPDLGWIGFDPTNNLIVGDRHIRVAVGRDYADVPPTRGTFKGKADTELAVSVRVSPSDAPPRDLDAEDEEPESPYHTTSDLAGLPETDVAERQEQPQQ